MASLGELFVKVGADIQGFKTAMGDVNTQLKTLDSEAAKSTAGFQAMGDRLTSLGVGMSAAITAPIVGLGAVSVMTAGKIEQLEVAFTGLLGSGEKASKMMRDLRDFAATTPFEFKDLAEAAKRMLAMGFAAEDILPNLRIIGDAVAGIGGGTAEINRVTLALGQMGAKGKVSAQEMNQLAELGIPAWKMLADEIGVSIPEAMKLAENGAISASDAIPAILSGMTQKFSGQMDAQNKKFLGQLSNFKDQIGFLLEDIGKVLIPFAMKALEAFQPILEALKKLTEAFSNLPGPVQTAIVAFAGLMAALGPILIIAGQLMTAWAALGPAIVAVKGAIAGLTAVCTPLLVAIGAIVAAFGAWKLGEWAYANVEPFRQAIDAVWGLVKALASTIADIVVAAFGAWWEIVKAVAGVLWEVFKPGVEAIVEVLKLFANVLGTIVGPIFNAFIDGLNLIASGINAWKRAFQEWLGTANQAEIKSHNVKAAYDAMGSAANAATATTQGLDKATGKKGFTAAADDASKATEKWKKELEELHRKQLKEARDEASRFNVTLQATAKAAGETYQKNEDLRRSLIAIKADLMQGRDAVWAMETALADMKEMLEGVGNEVQDVRKLTVPAFAEMSASVDDYKTDVGTLAKAYEALGLKSVEELKKIADAMEKAKDAVLNDEGASDLAKKTAIYKALEAQRDLAIALNTDLPEEQRKLMEKLGEELGSGLDKQKGKWEEFSTAVGTIIGNFATDIGKALFDGDLSWGEKFKSMLKDLAGAVVSVFITPATQAIATFVSDVLQNLLHGNFSAIGGLLGDLGQKIKDIFTVAPSVPTPSIPTPTNPTIPGTPGGGGGAGGALDAVGAIGSIATAVSSVIGNFQMMGMNKSLDIIVKHTLQTVMILETTFYWVTDFLGQIRNAILDSKDRLDWMSTAMSDGLDNLHQRLLEFRTLGMKIELAGMPGIPVTVEDFSDVALNRFAASMSKAVVIHNTVTLDGKVIADGVVEHLEDNGIVLP